MLGTPTLRLCVSSPRGGRRNARYLDGRPEFLKAVVWAEEGNGKGFYGLSVKGREREADRKVSSATAKAIQKVDAASGEVLNAWASVKKAAEAEGLAPAKMSRCVRDATRFRAGYLYRAAPKN